MSKDKKLSEVMGQKALDLRFYVNLGTQSDIVGIKSALKLLCVTINRVMADYEDKQAGGMRLGLNKGIGTAEAPIQLDKQFEGFKLDGIWSYRNSNPKTRGISRRWRTAFSVEENAEFDALYFVSIAGKEKLEDQREHGPINNLTDLRAKVAELTTYLEGSQPSDVDVLRDDFKTLCALAQWKING